MDTQTAPAVRPHEGRIAWITGGSSGIGARVVELLQADGALVGILDIQPPATETHWVECDISDGDAVRAAAARLRADLGEADILVNDAGVAGGGGPLAEYSDETWHHTLGVNLTGAFYLIRETLGHMKEQGWGRIVSVTSTSGVRVGVGAAAYSASKAGLIALARVAALEGAPHGVTSNIVAPGVVDTPMTRALIGDREALQHAVEAGPISNPMRKVLDPVDIATAIRFFTLPEARHISGELMYVNAASFMA